MINRTEPLLKLIGAAIVVLVCGYCAILYSASIEADAIQDERTALLLKGEAAKHLAEKRAAFSTMAVSDELFAASKNHNISEIAARLCTTASTAFATVGVLTLEGKQIYLCESGRTKAGAEHDYVFAEPRKIVEGAFEPVLQTQRAYGVVLPEFNFKERYVEIAGRAYLLITALIAPKHQSALSPDYRPMVVFGLSNVRVALRGVEQHLAIEDLILGTESPQDRPFVNLQDANEQSSLRLAWARSRIFRYQFFGAFPAIAGPSLLLLLLVIYFLRRISALQKDLARSEEQMRHAAMHDNLTGLPNRAYFMNLAEMALKAATGSRPVYLGMFDLDKFKAVNDAFGHDAGDALICEVARRAKQVFGEDNHVARLGGDEFAFVIRTARNPGEASVMLETLGTAVRKVFVYRGNALEPSCSIGAAQVSGDGASVNDVLKAADIALYEVKSHGRGYHRFFAQDSSAKLIKA